MEETKQAQESTPEVKSGSLYNRHNFAVAQFVSKEESRYTINGVLVTPTETVATDGHRMAVVTTPNHGVGLDDFPRIAGQTLKRQEGELLVPRETAVELSKKIPNKETIPVLNNAAPLAETETHAGFVYTDIETAHPVTFRKMTGKFPNWQAVMPKDTPVLEIGFNAQYLVEAARFLQSFSDCPRKTVSLTFYGSGKPVKMEANNSGTGQHATILIMPCRL